jgi:dihydrofolate synthase/folylpolyglutamate synthase
MTYSETLEYLFKQLPMYQRQGAVAYKKDLGNTLALMEILGNPHRKLKCIHVAGTNGKGSVSHMLAAAFTYSSFKTGLYTSPHLKDFRERIRIDGKVIPEEEVMAFVEKYRSAFEKVQPSFFEWTVALAFYYFAKSNTDICVIETGLGGRLDSTNIIDPVLSVITTIGMDHTEMLGDTLEKIALEKAGIIKAGRPVVLGNIHRVRQVLESYAKKKGSRYYHAQEIGAKAPKLSCELKGNYQKENCQTVYTAWYTLRQLGYAISYPQLEESLQKVRELSGLRGRWEIMQEAPKVIMDVGHNYDGLKFITAQLGEEEYEKLHLVLGFVKEKNLDEILPLFPKRATYYFCRPDIPRGMDVDILQKTAERYDLQGSVYSSVTIAYEAALKEASSKDLVFVGGSTFTVAEAI